MKLIIKMSCDKERFLKNLQKKPVTNITASPPSVYADADFITAICLAAATTIQTALLEKESIPI